jgi:hypothetical protein
MADDKVCKGCHVLHVLRIICIILLVSALISPFAIAYMSPSTVFGRELSLYENICLSYIVFGTGFWWVAFLILISIVVLTVVIRRKSC